jgi:hypothetical protein
MGVNGRGAKGIAALQARTFSEKVSGAPRNLREGMK